ncbi:hypothetical protein E4U55_004070 [Claviceps digitariae]|nr:hypothetical protein E4U55_004070 [Claviceps digitariae]
MTTNEKQAADNRRIAVVNKLVHSLDLKIAQLSPVAYSDDYQYAYNNYLYKVDLAVPATSSSFPGLQPGTVSAPSGGITSLIVKLSNAAIDVNVTNRVENDVAAHYLVRESMARAGLDSLVPAVYAWAPARADAKTDESDFGWVMMEVKDGRDLDREFPTLDSAKKQDVLQQIATILKAIQEAKLPETVTKFGGLTFDSTGQIISGQTPLVKRDPVERYADWKFGNLRNLLHKAGESPVIQGWKHNGVGARIEKFLAAGGPETLLCDVDQHQKCLVHGDFTTNNMLFDKTTNKITAILDFDWCTVSNPFDEFLLSLSDIGCSITYGQTQTDMALLSGHFTQPPEPEQDKKDDRWEMAQMWNAAMAKAGVASPCKIRGANQIYDMSLLTSLLCPHRLSNVSALAQMDENTRSEVRAKTEAEIVHWLETHGY